MRVTSSGLALRQKRGFEAWIPTQRDQIQCLFIPLLASGPSFSTAVIVLQWWRLIMAFRFDLNFFLFSFSHSLVKLSNFPFPKSFYSPLGLSTSSLNSLFSLFKHKAALVILTQHQLKLISARMGGKLLNWNSLQAFSTYLLTSWILVHWLFL